jgi:hypothetical protein
MATAVDIFHSDSIFRGRLARAVAFSFLGLLTAWGLRLTILEGFVYEWPLQFSGDFRAAMFDPYWWNGTGIMYGPVFVFERWLVNAWPGVFTVYLFALLNIPIMSIAFLLSAAAAGVTRTGAFVALAAWLCFWPLFYAFSVAANPEMLELLFLSLAWFAASRARPALAWVAVVIAALIKVIPAIFAPLLILRASSRAIVAAIVTGLVIVGAAGIGQQLTPRELVMAIVVPTQNHAPVTRQAQNIWPYPSTLMMTGLNSAMARAAKLKDDDPSLALVQRVSTAVTIGLYLAACFVAVRILRGRHALSEGTRLALAYGLFFALMPLMTFHTHPHTFVFLLPAWTAIIATLMDDGLAPRTMVFGAVFLLMYVFMGLPAVVVPVDRLLGTKLATSTLFADRIWANTALIVSLCAYAILRTRGAWNRRLAV